MNSCSIQSVGKLTFDVVGCTSTFVFFVSLLMLKISHFNHLKCSFVAVDEVNYKNEGWRREVQVYNMPPQTSLWQVLLRPGLSSKMCLDHGKSLDSRQAISDGNWWSGL